MRHYGSMYSRCLLVQEVQVPLTQCGHFLLPALVLKIIGRAKRFRLLNTRHRETVLVNSPMAMLNDITLSIRTVTSRKTAVAER